MPLRLIRYTVGALVLLGGCAQTPASPQAALPAIYDRSTHHVTQLPQPASACIVANAKKRDYFAAAAPLYGMSVMSVTVRTIAAGGATLAIITLQRAENASTTAASVATPAGSFEDRKASVEQLLAGC